MKNLTPANTTLLICSSPTAAHQPRPGKSIVIVVTSTSGYDASITSLRLADSVAGASNPLYEDFHGNLIYGNFDGNPQSTGTAAGQRTSMNLVQSIMMAYTRTKFISQYKMGVVLKMTHVSDLTICTVSFNSKLWLDLNLELTSSLNPNTRINWVIAENSPPESVLRLDSNDRRFTLIPSARFEKKIYASGSYHHAAGMNKTLAHIDSRYALFLDPDFFIIKDHWAREMIEHMQTNSLAILGVPWHPRWFLKNRYFPCVHCMLVDLEKIPLATLDFSPDYETIPGYKDNEEIQGMIRKSQRLLLRIFDPLKFRKRRYIGTSRDVSWRIYAHYFGNSYYRIECLQPVFRTQQDRLQYWLEKILPDRFSFIPKQPGYFTDEGFRERGLADLDSLGWEEFMWRKQPFGFHVRSQPKVTSNESMNFHYTRLVEFLNLSQLRNKASQVGRGAIRSNTCNASCRT